jgi:DNA primase
MDARFEDALKEVCVGRIPDEDVEKVRDATDVVSLVSESVTLKQKGRLWWGCCPFHTEKTPSFKVDPASGLWHCFGCGTGGDAIGFIMKTEQLDFPDAVRRLAERAHVEIREESTGMPSGMKERLLAASEEAARFYHKLLTTSRDAGPAEARAYLKRRGIDLDVAKSFRLGYAPSSRKAPLAEHLRAKGFKPEELVAAGLAMSGDRGLRDRFFGRIMFPIANLAGQTIAFGGRVIGAGEPKYLNSAETPLFHKSSNLYAIDRAKNEIVRTSVAVVVEGYTDVIALHVAGLPYTVATLGTALTEQHVKLLARFAKRVVYLFDGDDAGVRAAKRAEEFLGLQATPEASEGRLDLKVALIPDGLDPADFVGQRGGEALTAVIDAAVPLLRFALDQRLAAHDLGAPEGRSAALRDAAEVLGRIGDSLLVHDYANVVADRLAVDYTTVQQAVLAAGRDVKRRERTADAKEAASASPSGAAAESAAPRVSDPERLAQEELLRVLARSAHLRDGAQELLGWDAVSDPAAKRLLAVLLQVPQATGHDLFDAVSAREPSLADMMSAYIVSDGDPSQDEENFRQLVGRLKEFSIRRQIKQVQAQLQTLDPVKQRSEYDDASRKAVALRADLDGVVRARLSGGTGHGGVKA